jgi:undecaprenyl diphosphate synthase
MSTVPKHIGIIMDGNRRFSKRLMLKPWKGHEWGAEKLRAVINWCTELGIEELTVYAFSVQNFERSKEELDVLMRIFIESFEKLTAEYNQGLHRTIRAVFIGRRNLFPQAVQQAMHDLEEASKTHVGVRVNIAMGYGGREEIIDAVKKIGEAVQQGNLDPKTINESVFSNALYMDHEPELIIRTGGEHRTSNFLLWQSHYAEWFFLEKLWPEFEKEDLLTVLASYASRERRFGK